MDSRKLTGKWRLHKRLFGYRLMVETKQTTTCPNDLTTSPEFYCWEKAKPKDIVELNIKCT